MQSFRLVAFETRNCSSTTMDDVLSCVRGDFVLERMILPHLGKTFFPQILCVIVSYFSYWIRCSPVRVTLIMTDFLVTMYFWHSTMITDPITNYPKYVDIFTGTTISFVLFAIFEFVVVQNVFKRELANDKLHSMLNDIRRNWVDNLCRLLIPLFFALFLFLFFTSTVLSRP